MASEKVIPIVRDLVCLGLGSFGFVWQVTHGAEVVLMTGCILVLGGPALMGAWSRTRNGGSDTTGSPSPSPPSSFSPLPSSPSSPGGES